MKQIKVLKKLLKPLKSRYQNNLELMKGSELLFDYGNVLYCECHKIYPNCGRSYVDPMIIFSWLGKKQKINPINKKDNKCFQYAVTLSLNQEEVKKYPQRTAKVQPFKKK